MRSPGSRACGAPELNPRSGSREPTWDLGPWGSLGGALGSWSYRAGDRIGGDAASSTGSTTPGHPRSSCSWRKRSRSTPSWRLSWWMKRRWGWPSVCPGDAKQPQCLNPEHKWKEQMKIVNAQEDVETWWKPGLPTLLSGFKARNSEAASLYL